MRSPFAFAMWLAACSGSGSARPHVVVLDATAGFEGIDESGDCNLLTQSGCFADQKCTWVFVSAGGSGAVGGTWCAPAGSAAIGAPCTRNPPGYATGYDDCVKGAYCLGPAAGGAGTCEAICDQSGGASRCGWGRVCVTHDGLFGPAGMPVAAGLCDPACDPIADNNFLGSNGNNRSGSACGSDGSAVGSGFIYANGCYGYPDGRFGQTQWACRPQLDPSRFHRTACDTTQHAGDSSTCALSANSIQVNGCASGYEPMFTDAEGSTQLDCIALCSPAPCYNAGSGGSSIPSCGSGLASLAGDPATGHSCDPANFQHAAFTPASGNGEQCFYSWLFEFDASNNFVVSPTSDTVGFCIDHSRYAYDPTGGSNDTTAWPRCDQIGLGSQGYGVGPAHLDAAYFGCVDTATARTYGDLPFGGKTRLTRPVELRLPYPAR